MADQGSEAQGLDLWLWCARLRRARADCAALVEAGTVRINGNVARPATRVHESDHVEVVLPPPEHPSTLPADYVPVPIIYEDHDIIVFDKPAGLVTHPAPGHERGTLVNVLRARRPDLQLNATDRPGIVHRLDKDTSGLIVMVKNEAARRYMLRQWQSRDVVKRYIALVHGVLDETEGTIDAPISRDPSNRKRMWVVPGGRPAITHFQVVERFRDATLMDVQIVTGRTHQIRVHFAFIGHPVVGDPLYGKRPFRVPLKRQFLHAYYLKFRLPSSGEEIELETTLPDDLAAVLDALRSERDAGG